MRGLEGPRLHAIADSSGADTSAWQHPIRDAGRNEVIYVTRSRQNCPCRPAVDYLRLRPED